ncbi:MAG: hypothetical protein ACRDPA_16300, partial [Solirubrobacteraceae bacterium]
TWSHPGCPTAVGFTRITRCALIHTSECRLWSHVSREESDRRSRPRRYEIRVRGPVGPTMMEAFPTLAATSRGQDPLLTGSLPDQSALYGVIHQLEALGLELLEIRCLPTSVRPDITDKDPLT